MSGLQIYLDIRSMYDVQISSRYNDVYDEKNLPDDNYELVTDFLSEHGIETDYDCTFSLYLPSKDDFHNRMKYDFPVVAISLSDYNTIRKMLGYEPITLSEDEFTTQWQSIATNEERDSFLKEHSSIMTDAGELTLSEHSFYEEAIGETAYNSYTDVLYVFPDSICENLLPVIRNRYIMTTESISYENARALEQTFSAEYPEITDTGVSYAIRLNTVHDVTLEYPGQIIKLSAYDKPASLGVTITKRGNAQVMAGQSMRYDLTVANTSNVPLESFFWHDKIPYDVARPTTLTTGTYSARLNYRILYKTNCNTSYQVLASNLLTSNNYSFSLNAIPMQAGEVVTDIYFDFGKVPVGFQSVVNPTLSVMVNGNAVNGYQMVNRADVGGKYQGTWQTATASWVTIIRRLWNTPTLPKTGY